MKRFFGRENGQLFYIENDELNHLRVLRLCEGDKIVGNCGDEFDSVCVIKKIDKKVAVCEVESKSLNKANPKKRITLFQAMPKREHLETILQKAVELGAEEFVPFVSTHSVNKEKFNVVRASAIVQSATKQCERSKCMMLTSLISFQEVLNKLKEFDIVLFANEREGKVFDFSSLSKYNNIAVVVGAEGGFTQDEKNKILALNAQSISLGSRILRCETASIVMLSLASIFSNN